MHDAETTTRQPNRLIHEKSPYLQQHAYNPVAWYPWGDEAFARAAKENKPVFLSIGYSTCHWCHVMERESFEDPAVAELMNQSFVSIKVDREEHPDVDQLYMSAVMMLTGQGGWPLTVFLTPERKPFFGGTYFPPERRGPMPGMKELLPSVAQAWRDRRDEIRQSSEQVAQALQERLAHDVPSGPISDEALQRAFNQAVQTYDPTWGGFGGAPKFPRSHELSWLLHFWSRTDTRQALDMVTATLDALARGGIHDHLGGGFHRYATDARWLVPHFEKMLYDQALLARTYLEAYRATKRQDYAEVARDILDYVLRDLTDAQGAFYSAEDADSEGEEGKFYVWTPEETMEALGAEAAELFNRFYGVTPEGNFSAEGGSAPGGEHSKSILHVERPLEEFARVNGLDPADLARRLTEAREKLLAVRSQRIRPHRDDKVLTSWNGLMIGSFAYAASTLGEDRYLKAAQRAADFILETLNKDSQPFDSAQGSGERAKRVEPQLLRRYRDGEARYGGTLEDYAFLTYGLLELYEAGFDPRYLAQADALASQMLERFWDEDGGGFFMRDKGEPALIARVKEVYDGALPSGNSVAALALLRLGRMTANQRFEDAGRRTLETFAQTVERLPGGSPQLLIAWDFALGPTREIVIAGDRDAKSTSQFLEALRSRWLPGTVTLLHADGPEGDRARLEALAPFVTSQGPINGKTTAYVCEQYICKLPVTDVATFLSLLQ